MPGKNSAHDSATMDNWRSYISWNIVWVIVIAQVTSCEIMGMTRFFYQFEHKRWIYESIAWTFIFIFFDIMVFTGLFATKNSDPGYIIPPTKEV